MQSGGSNVRDSFETISSIVQIVNRCAFDPDQTDFSPCFQRDINRSFMHRYNFTVGDIRSILNSLRPEEYCHTSKENGKPDAYIFSPDTDEDIRIYLKLLIEEGVVVISLHEADRDLSFPFRRRQI